MLCSPEINLSQLTDRRPPPALRSMPTPKSY